MSIWGALTLSQKESFGKAISECQTATRLSENNPFYMACLGYAYARADKRNEALHVLHQLEMLSQQKYVASHDIAAIYAGLGDPSKAISWLNKAYDERSYAVLLIEVEPEFDALHSDPRFQALVQRIGPPQ